MPEAAGLNDTFKYLHRQVVTTDRAEDLLSKGHSVSHVIDRVVEDFEDEIDEKPGTLLEGRLSAHDWIDLLYLM